MSVLLAGVLSLIGTGAGQIFAGNFAEGIITALLFIFTKPVLVPLFIRFLRVTQLRRVLQLLYACNLFYMGLIVCAFVRSVWVARHAEDFYFWYGFIAAVCVVFTYKNIFNEFIFSSLCGRTEIYNWARGKINSPTENDKK